MVELAAYTPTVALYYIMNNVAEVLQEQGNEQAEELVEAEDLQRKALNDRVEALGKDHPYTPY
jgi:hypothetical protein